MNPFFSYTHTMIYTFFFFFFGGPFKTQRVDPLVCIGFWSGPEFSYFFFLVKDAGSGGGKWGVVRRKMQWRKLIHLPLSSPIIRHVWIRSVRTSSLVEINQWMHQSIFWMDWIQQHLIFLKKRRRDIHNKHMH